MMLTAVVLLIIDRKLLRAGRWVRGGGVALVGGESLSGGRFPYGVGEVQS
jgi:hypothetical protein